MALYWAYALAIMPIRGQYLLFVGLGSLCRKVTLPSLTLLILIIEKELVTENEEKQES